MNQKYRAGLFVLFAPVVLVGIIHIIGGASAIYSSKAILVTQLYGVSILTNMIIEGYPSVVGSLLIIIGVLAICSRYMDLNQNVKIGLITPQQLICIVQLGGVCYAIWQGVYPDGYIPATTWYDTAWFMIGDQAALIVLTLAHTSEFLSLKYKFPTPLQVDLLTKENFALVAKAESLAYKTSISQDKDYYMRLTKDIARDIEGR